MTGAWTCFVLGLSAKELGLRCHNRTNPVNNRVCL